MKNQIINWEKFKKSKLNMIILFVGGFFALVGASQFITAFIKFLF